MEIDISKMQQTKVDGTLYLRASEVCEKAGFRFRSMAHLKELGIPDEWILLANFGVHPKSKPLAYVTQEALIYLIITNPFKREENFEAGRVLAKWVVSKIPAEKVVNNKQTQ